MRFADFVIPDTLQEARELLTKLGPAGFPVAGATAFQYISDRPGITAVDISRLLPADIVSRNGFFEIGANTLLADVAQYRAAGWVLHRIATLIPTHQIRNISTVGGNIARLFPWSDLPLGLLVLDAAIVLENESEKSYPAREFFAKQPAQWLQPGELVTRVRVPALRPGMGFGYRKQTLTNSAFSLMTAAAVVGVSDGRLRQVRIAVNSAVPIPAVLPAIEAALEKQPADEERIRAEVITGVAGLKWLGREGMSDEFARHLAGIVVADAVWEAVEEAAKS